MLKRPSAYLSDHPLWKHTVFLVLAIITIWVNGYHFGTFDQFAHIPFLKKTINPDLYSGDVFINMRDYHFSYFWFLFFPMARAGLLEESMFLIHLLTVYGTIRMFWSLSELLFEDPRANLLVTLALIFPHLGFPGFQVIEFSLLNRTFALPFILGSIWLYLKNKRLLAYLLLGLMLNIHAIYSVFVLCMFLTNEGLSFKVDNWWKPLLGLAAFTLMGLPVLVWRLQTGSGIDLSLRPELISLAARSLLYTVYYPIGPFSFSIGNFFAGIGTVWAFILGYRQVVPSLRHQIVKNFMLAVGVLLLVGVITSYMLPITFLLQFQIMRAGVFLLYFGMLYLSAFLSSMENQGKIGDPRFLLLVFSFIILVTPLITILGWLLSRAFIRLKVKPVWLAPFVITALAGTTIISLQSGLWSPGIYVFGSKSAWKDIQLWARDNTPVEAGFITPPHLFGHYTPDWRVFSERATLVSIAESMEVPFNPAFMESFRSRFTAVAPNAIDFFNGNYMQSIQIAEENFYSNSSQDFVRIACQHNLDYLVVEKGHPYPFNERYRNEGFILYQLPACRMD
jgi:hypothetical protein